MRVFVTGGTGFTGPAIVRAMLAAGHQVTCLVHRQDAPPGATAVRASLHDEAALAAAMAGHDAVAHLVAIRRGTPADFERMHTEAARAVLAAAKQAGVRRFLLMSANDADVGTTPYFRTKRAMEAMVRASDTDWTIFRPSYISSADEGGFDHEFAAVVDKAPLLPSFGGGRFEIQPIARDDVALAFARALDRPIALGKTYILVGRERFTWNEYLRRLALLRGRKPRLVRVPRWAILALSKVAGRAFPASPDELRMLMMGSVGDPEPAARDLDLPLEPWERAVAGLAR